MPHSISEGKKTPPGSPRARWAGSRALQCAPRLRRAPPSREGRQQSRARGPTSPSRGGCALLPARALRSLERRHVAAPPAGPARASFPARDPLAAAAGPGGAPAWLTLARPRPRRPGPRSLRERPPLRAGLGGVVAPGFPPDPGCAAVLAVENGPGGRPLKSQQKLFSQGPGPCAFFRRERRLQACNPQIVENAGIEECWEDAGARSPFSAFRLQAVPHGQGLSHTVL